MRSLFLTSIIVFGNLFAWKCAGQPVTNNPATIVDTNLVICTLSIEWREAWWGYGSSPICFVKLDNKTSSTNSGISNSGIFGLHLSAEKLFAISLVDTNGQSVEKTDYGKQFDQPLTQKKLNDWIIPIEAFSILFFLNFQF